MKTDGLLTMLRDTGAEILDTMQERMRSEVGIESVKRLMFTFDEEGLIVSMEALYIPAIGFITPSTGANEEYFIAAERIVDEVFNATGLPVDVAAVAVLEALEVRGDEFYAY